MTRAREVAVSVIMNRTSPVEMKWSTPELSTPHSAGVAIREQATLTLTLSLTLVRSPRLQLTKHVTSVSSMHQRVA